MRKKIIAGVGVLVFTSTLFAGVDTVKSNRDQTIESLLKATKSLIQDIKILKEDIKRLKKETAQNIFSSYMITKKGSFFLKKEPSVESENVNLFKTGEIIDGFDFNKDWIKVGNYGFFPKKNAERLDNSKIKKVIISRNRNLRSSPEIANNKIRTIGKNQAIHIYQYKIHNGWRATEERAFVYLPRVK